MEAIGCMTHFSVSLISDGCARKRDCRKKRRCIGTSCGNMNEHASLQLQFDATLKTIENSSLLMWCCMILVDVSSKEDGNSAKKHSFDWMRLR